MGAIDKSISRTRKIWILFFAFLTAIFFTVFIFSIVYEDKFYDGVKAEALLAAVLAAIICLEIAIEKNAKYIYPLTLLAYVSATLLVRCFVPSLRLLVSPVISWGSIILILANIIASIVLLLRRKTT